MTAHLFQGLVIGSGSRAGAASRAAVVLTVSQPGDRVPSASTAVRIDPTQELMCR